MKKLLKYICVLLFNVFAVAGFAQQAQDTTVTQPATQIVVVQAKDSLPFIDTLLQNLSQPVNPKEAESSKKDTVEHKGLFSKLPGANANLDAPSFNGIVTPSKIIWTLIFIGIGFVIVRILSIFLSRIGSRSVKYRILVKRLEPILKITVWMFVIFIIIKAIINPPMAMVVAFFNSISVAVGFAAQDLLKNIFGGLMILFDRPFQIGDKIQVGSEYGEVTNIGLRSTRIVTADDSEITVPNAVMMNSSISNSNTGQSNCQVVAEIYLPIGIDTQKVRKIAIEAAKVSRYIYLNKPVVVIFVNEIQMGKSVYKMRLKAYVSDLRYEFAFKSDMTEITLKALLKEGILQDSPFS